MSASNWTKNNVGEVFKDAQGMMSVVILREAPGEDMSQLAQDLDYIVFNEGSVVKEGVRAILEQHGKEWPAMNVVLSPANLNNQLAKFPEIEASANEAWKDMGTTWDWNRRGEGSQIRQLLHIAGLPPGALPNWSRFGSTKAIKGTRHLDCVGPHFAQAGAVLFKVCIHPSIFNREEAANNPNEPAPTIAIQGKTFKERTQEILQKGLSSYKEIEFSNYSELEKQLLEISATLKEYKREHDKLQKGVKDKKTKKTSYKRFEGPVATDKYPYTEDAERPLGEVYGTLDLEEQSDRLEKLAENIKKLLVTNGIDPSEDKIAVGFYPVPKAANPATSNKDVEPEVVGTQTGEYELTITAQPIQSNSFNKITVRSENPKQYSNKYSRSAGETLWDITSFYLGNGTRWQEIVELNQSTSVYRKRGWLSAAEISAITNKDQLTAADQKKLDKAENPELKSGDVLKIPVSWLEEIANDLAWYKAHDTAKGSIIVYSPSLVAPPAPPEIPSYTDDGVSYIAAEDPWFDYNKDSIYKTSVGKGQIAYIRRSTPEFEKTLKRYKSAKSNQEKAQSGKDPDPEQLSMYENVTENTKAALNKVAASNRVFLWPGFLPLVYSPEAIDYRTVHFLTNMDIVIREPGVVGSLARFCSGSKKPPKSKKKIRAFVRKYIYDAPILVDFVPRGVDEIIGFYETNAQPPPAGATSKPKTEKELNTWNKITKDPITKEILSKRNVKLNSIAGDMVFASMPRSVNKINTLSDVHKYILGRLSIPQMAAEILKCLGLSMSIDDLIEALCDGFLRSIGADPNKIDEFFEILNNGDFNVDIKGIELFDTADFVHNVQRDLATMIASGVDDPFYNAMIKQNIGNAQGKRIICEIIMGAMFAMADMLANLDSTVDPRERPDKKCSIRFSLPKIPPFGSIIEPIWKQIQKRLYAWLEEQIRDVAKNIIENIIEFCAEEDPVFAAEIPQVIDEEALATALAPLNTEPRDFLSHLLSTLTAGELCQLVEGTARKPLLLQVRKFMKFNYPESFYLFSTDYKILSFFKNLQGVLDLSSCRGVPREMVLDDLCKDGETPREAALRRSLLAKGLTPEQAEEQLEIQRQIKKDIVSDLVTQIVPSDKLAGAMEALDINSVISESESLNKSNGIAVSTVFDGVQNSIYLEIGNFIPTIFTEIDKLKKEGNYEFTKLPLFDVIYASAHRLNWEFRVNSNSPTNRNKITLIPPTINYKPGEYKVLFPGTTQEKVIDKKGQMQIDFKMNKKLVYSDVKTNDPLNTDGKDDIYIFDVYKGVQPKFTSVKGSEGFDIKDEELKEILDEYSLVYNHLSKRMDIFGQILKKKVEEQYDYTLETIEETSTYCTDGSNCLDSETTAFAQEALSLQLKTVNQALETYGGYPGTQYLSSNVAPTEGVLWFLSEYIYDVAYVSIIDRIMAVIATSEYYDVSMTSPLRKLDFLKQKFGELSDVKNSTNTKISEYMGNHDFMTGEPPTYMGEAIFEGLVQSIIKSLMIQDLMRTVFVFSKFKIADAFSDPVLSEYLAAAFKNVSNGQIYSAYNDYMTKKEIRVREKLELIGPSSTPPAKTLTEDEIEEEIKNQVFGGLADNAEEYLLELIGQTAELMKGKLISVFNLKLKGIDQKFELGENGVTQDFQTIALDGQTTNVMNHIHEYVIDENGNGIAKMAYHPENPEIGHEHAIENFAVAEAQNEALGAHAHELQLKDFPQLAVNTITTLNSDLNSETWRKSTTSNTRLKPAVGTSTCMQEHFNGGTLIQIPPGVTLSPGTNWDPGERVLKNLDSPAEKTLKASYAAPAGTYKWKEKYGGFSATPFEVTGKGGYTDGNIGTKKAIKQAKKWLEGKFKGLWNPMGPTFPSYDPAIWDDLANVDWAGGEYSWTEDNPFEPMLGVAMWWEPSSLSFAIIGTSITSPPPTGYKIRVRRTIEYEKRDKGPRNKEEYHIFSSTKTTGDGVPQVLVKSGDGFYFGQHWQPKEGDTWGKGYIHRDEGQPYPMIRLSVPTRGTGDIDIEKVTEINFKINGENIHQKPRVILVGQTYGRVYELQVNSVEGLQEHENGFSYGNVINVTIPIAQTSYKLVSGKLESKGPLHPEGKSSVQITDSLNNALKLPYGHGHVDFINGKKVEDDVFYLIVENPESGERAAAPVQFHTFTPFGRGHNSADSLIHYTGGGYDTTVSGVSVGKSYYTSRLVPSFEERFGAGMSPIWNTEPSVNFPFFLGPKPDTGVYDFFPLTMYEDENEPAIEYKETTKKNADGEDEITEVPYSTQQAWPVVDVADPLGIRSYDNGRATILVSPRLTRTDLFPKFRRSGNFVVEKYIKIKFKPFGVLTSMVSTAFALKLYHHYAGAGLQTQLDRTSLGLGAAEETLGVDKFGNVPGLTVRASIPQKLSSNSFKRLQQELLGYKDEINPTTGLPTGTKTVKEGDELYLNSNPFAGPNGILDEVSYGLRVSYVLPFDISQNVVDYSPNQSNSLIFNNLKEMFSPTLDENQFKNTDSFRQHYILTQAQNKVFHMQEYLGDTNTLNAGMYQLPDIFEAKPWGGYGSPSSVQDVFLFPLVEVEMDKDDPSFPTSIVTFQDLLAGYPDDDPAGISAYGKGVYEELYVRLKSSPEFKFLFDYVMPTKRALALATIYNMLAFDDVFPDPCKFQALFSTSTKVQSSLMEKLGQDLTLLSVSSDADFDIAELIREANGFKVSCSPGPDSALLKTIMGQLPEGFADLPAMQAIQAAKEETEEMVETAKNMVGGLLPHSNLGNQFEGSDEEEE